MSSLNNFIKNNWLKPRPPNGKWFNKKSGKIREGWWEYYWPGDVFYVEIKGLTKRKVYDDSPEYGDWELIRDTAPL